MYFFTKLVIIIKVEVGKMKYNNLFSRGKIGKLELKNRIVMPAMGTSLASANGEASDEIIRYYEERAEGGCGLIITEIARIDDFTGIGTPCQLCVNDLKFIPRLEKLARAVHRHDTKIFIQLHHPGRENHARLIGGRQIVGPSAVMSSAIGEMPRELTTEEVENLVKQFVFGAYVAKSAGMDGVEIHGAHGYLVGQFLSPLSNLRTDKYGGSFEGRLRFLTEIVVGIKNTCGKQFPISVRIDGDEFLPGGFDLEQAASTAKYLESLGVDVINVSAGTYETVNTIIEPIAYPQGWKKHLSAAIKKAVSIPVIACDVIRKPDFAEALLEEGNLDFVAVGRGQLADPQWGVKAQGGREKDIRQCISCLYCIENVLECKVVKCAVNARAGRETEFTDFNINGQGRTVAVLGGGPAGMEAARVLAIRGFKPVIFEKENYLGGNVRVGSMPPLKDKLTWFLDNLIYQLEELKVEIRLGWNFDIEDLKKLNPYSVFVATGGSNVVPKLPGVEDAKVYSVNQVLLGQVSLEGKNITVIGSGMTGLETAEYLAAKNNKVTVIEMLEKIGPGAYLPNLIDVVTRLKKYGVELIPGTKLLEITESGVKVEAVKLGEVRELKSDAVVLSVGVKNDPGFVASIREQFENVKVIGDVAKVGRIGQAIQTGFEYAYYL
jgi:2,4-dienoyl-CoA reductase-like NADH-dependent reductase (Old Yellow Enzyme family)/thioredoxin reductase